MTAEKSTYMGLLMLLSFFGGIVAADELEGRAPVAKIPTVKEIAAMLPQKPSGLGRPITDRKGWQGLAKVKSYQRILAAAEQLLAKPFPETTDELYLDFSRTGKRDRWQKANSSRRSWIRTLTIAECLENEGRFLPKLQEAVAEICKERTWVMPAHDRGLANFQGRRVDIDLGSSGLAWELATMYWLLGEKLAPETRKLVADNVRKRIIEPFTAMAAGKRDRNWWMDATNNWNAVCLAGVTGSALAMVEPRDQRAGYVRAAMEYSKNFLRGFGRDGYCTEGLGYWGYGFGHFTMLAEMIHQATGGKIDLLDSPHVREVAMFPEKIHILNGISPAFADCGVFVKPDKRMVHFLQRRYGLADSSADDASLVAADGTLPQAMLMSFPNSAMRAPLPDKPAAGAGIRTWFDQAGVLVGRPHPGSSWRIGVALKGGHNAEHHNHNDVGSYVVVLGNRPVLVDPGGEVYTARTFSSRRYESNLLNSFGHPVPRVAGQLQRPGADARAKVLKTNFSDEADTLILDLAGAYDVKSLKTLTRTFIYSRRGAGSLTVIDEVAFGEPQAFETGLITLGAWEKADKSALTITDEGQSLRVEFAGEGGAIEIASEQIKEHTHLKPLPTRVGLRFKRPVTRASITLTISPVEDKAGTR